MFNLSGSEIVVILLLALVVLGPEKLPDALRRAGRTYSELKKMGNSFQSEMKSVLDEPMREMRETADLLKQSVDFTDGELTGKRSPARTVAARTTSSPADSPLAGASADAATPAPTEPIQSAAPAEPPTAAADQHPAAPAVDAPPAGVSDERQADDELINRTLSGEQ